MANATTWTLGGNSTAEEVFDLIINHLDDEMDMWIVNKVFGGMDLEFGIERTGIWLRERKLVYTGDINEPVPFRADLVKFTGELTEAVLEKVIEMLECHGTQYTPLWRFRIDFPVSMMCEKVGTIWGRRC